MNAIPSIPKGIAARGLVNLLFVLQGLVVSAGTSHVWQDSPKPVSPYTIWATAAHTIQEAVDVAAPGDDILVTNGVHATGGRAVDGLMTNRVVVAKALTVRSVNGPAVTLIQGHQVPGTTNGDGAVRCAYLAGGGVLGGGLEHCILTGTSAAHSISAVRLPCPPMEWATSPTNRVS